MVDLSRRQTLAAVVAAGGAVLAPRYSRAMQPEPLPQTVPNRIDLSAMFPPAKEQGDRNSCAFFSTVALVEAMQTKLTGVVTPLSEQFLIHVVKRNALPPIEQNSSNADALDAAREYGVPPENWWPYNPVSWLGRGQRCEEYATPQPTSPNPFVNRPDTPASCFAQGEPPLAVFQKAKSIAANIQPAVMAMQVFPFGTWGDAGNPGRRVTTVINRLAKGSPLVVVAKLADDSDGWADTGALTVPKSLQGRKDLDIDDSPVGNHFIVLTGYDMDRRVLFFRNSWGESWGDKGYGHISFETFNTPIIIHQPFSLRMPKLAKPA
jgi:hypothetical protein